MSVYVEQSGGFWKLTAKQWAKIVTLALAEQSFDLSQYTPMLSRRPPCVIKSENGEMGMASAKHRLVKPLNWSPEDWEREAREIGVLKNVKYRVMIETEKNVYKSRDGYRLSRIDILWTMTNETGRVEGTSRHLNDITEQFERELLSRFI